MSKTSIVSKLFQATVGALVVTAFLSLGGTACAGDREDAKALVGKWKEQTFVLPDDFEFKADGTSRGGFIPWTVKKGKLVITNIAGKDTEYDYTLSPDEKTLKFDGRTYKRQ